jgi:hypothetical protein
MKNRFKNNLYTQEIIVTRGESPHYIRNQDGTLFSGHQKTKILPPDLPEWYVRGRYSGCWGYLSVKGITDLQYVPNNHINHFLKDDFLYIAYGDKMQRAEVAEDRSFSWAYTGFDEVVWGSEIISTLKGAQLYSDYDISGIIQQIKEKKDWLINSFPKEFGPGKWDFDVDKYFSEPFNNGR